MNKLKLPFDESDHNNSNHIAIIYAALVLYYDDREYKRKAICTVYVIINNYCISHFVAAEAYAYAAIKLIKLMKNIKRMGRVPTKHRVSGFKTWHKVCSK